MKNSSQPEDMILISVSGPDHPGITHRLMAVLAKGPCEIIDMGQSVTHNLLSLSFVIKISNDDDQGPVLKDLLFEAKKLGQTLDFQILESEESRAITKNENSTNFVLSCVSSKRITPQFLSDIAGELSHNNVNINRIDNLRPADFQGLEITAKVPKQCEVPKFKQALIKVSNAHKIDVALIKNDVYRRSKRLIVFDMDSTLIQTEVIDELAQEAGVGDEVKALTEKAMNGEIDFNQSLAKRVSTLKGLSIDSLKQVLSRLELTPGTEEFINTVKNLGYKVAIISGGFTFFAYALKDKLGLDYAFANELEIQDGALTGKVLGQVVDAKQKSTLLQLIAQQEKISLEQVVAIGDGANDLDMLSKAGLGIAFHAKDIVRKSAQNHLSHGPMTSILYFLGIPGPRAH